MNQKEAESYLPGDIAEIGKRNTRWQKRNGHYTAMHNKAAEDRAKLMRALDFILCALAGEEEYSDD